MPTGVIAPGIHGPAFRSPLLACARLTPEQPDAVTLVAFSATVDDAAGAVAVFIVQCDEPGEHAPRQLSHVTGICAAAGAIQHFASSDSEESGAFVAARRKTIPAMERRYTPLLKDVGVPLPRLGELVSGVAETAFGEIMQLAIRLGGVITGEHGGGGLTQPWLARYLGTDAMELNRRIKRALAPDSLFNPGATYGEQQPGCGE